LDCYFYFFNVWSKCSMDDPWDAAVTTSRGPRHRPNYEPNWVRGARDRTRLLEIARQGNRGALNDYLRRHFSSNRRRAKKLQELWGYVHPDERLLWGIHHDVYERTKSLKRTLQGCVRIGHTKAPLPRRPVIIKESNVQLVARHETREGHRCYENIHQEVTEHWESCKPRFPDSPYICKILDNLNDRNNYYTILERIYGVEMFEALKTMHRLRAEEQRGGDVKYAGFSSGMRPVTREWFTKLVMGCPTCTSGASPTGTSPQRTLCWTGAHTTDGISETMSPIPTTTLELPLR